MVTPYQHSAKLLRALSHPVRLTLLDALGADEECVCHLAAVTGKRQAYVSQQLACLRRAGLVKMRKDGQRVYYRVDDSRASAILENLLNSRGGYRLVQGCDCPRCVRQAG